MTESEARRNPRLRLACARCQRRKIRCNGQYPRCSNCTKASAECVDGESVRLRNVPRDRIVQRLKSRVTWLESIIRERLPDVDLSSNESPEAQEMTGDDQEGQTKGRVANEDRLAEPAIDQAAFQPVPPDQRAHEIGLISVGVNADQRYIGPSSGYFLARIVLACSPRANAGQDPGSYLPNNMAQSTINELVTASQGPLPLPAQSIANQLCQVYFQTVHPQYPILHEPSFRRILDQVYQSSHDTTEGTQRDSYGHFQVYMIPGESYCLSALQYFDRLNTETSLSGLQCMLLLSIFTLHSPNMRLNVWNLNYQCLAAVLDLGLQRHVTTSMGISLLEQEMRTRVFWVVFALDRTIATMMGRPIGLRDEACELRLPQSLNDGDLINVTDTLHDATGSIEFSIHLFKLAKLTSEIKYVANSVVREAPTYAYPAILDVNAWQRNMLGQLDQWFVATPQSTADPSTQYNRTICYIRYYSTKMLLLRPSPAIPKPSTKMLIVCHESARQSIRLHYQLYKEDLLIHDWLMLHGIILSTITILYCTRMVPEVAQKTELEELMVDMSSSLSMLSAAGEHWASAKRSRDILEELSRATICWLKTMQNAEPLASTHGDNTQWNAHSSFPLGTDRSMTEESISTDRLTGGVALDTGLDVASTGSLSFVDNINHSMQMDTNNWGDAFPQRHVPSEIINLDDIVRSLFDEFIPMETYDAMPGLFG